MNVTIANLSDQRVLLRFASGATLALAAHEEAGGIDNVEVKGNRRISHLEGLGLVKVIVPEAKASKMSGRKPSTKKRASPRSRSRAKGAPSRTAAPSSRTSPTTTAGASSTKSTQVASKPAKPTVEPT